MYILHAFLFISRCNQSFVSERVYKTIRERGEMLRVDIPMDLFDDLNLAIDNTWHLSNAKTIIQVCVNVWIKEEVSDSN